MKASRFELDAVTPMDREARLAWANVLYSLHIHRNSDPSNLALFRANLNRAPHALDIGGIGSEPLDEVNLVRAASASPGIINRSPLAAAVAATHDPSDEAH
jgi:hypothetical protein